MYVKEVKAMKYVFQFGRILLFCFLGELLHMVLPLPIPASIYGLILLLIALLTGIVKLEQVEETGKYLVLIFPIMFVPAAAGVMVMWDEISAMLIPIILATVVVTALVMGVAGKVTELVINRGSSAAETNKGGADHE